MADRWQPMYVTVDRELLLRFFVTFARFEYALKNSRFFKAGRSNRDNFPPPIVEPDWKAFVLSIQSDFHMDANVPLQEACEYLLCLTPPLLQVVDKGTVMWDTTPPSNQGPQIIQLLRCVQRVRNNLFHGAKFSDAPVGDMGRNAHLLSHSLIILEEWLRLSGEVRAVYDSAVL